MESRQNESANTPWTKCASMRGAAPLRAPSQAHRAHHCPRPAALLGAPFPSPLPLIGLARDSARANENGDRRRAQAFSSLGVSCVAPAGILFGRGLRQSERGARKREGEGVRGRRCPCPQSGSPLSIDSEDPRLGVGANDRRQRPSLATEETPGLGWMSGPAGWEREGNGAKAPMRAPEGPSLKAVGLPERGSVACFAPKSAPVWPKNDTTRK